MNTRTKKQLAIENNRHDAKVSVPKMVVDKVKSGLHKHNVHQGRYDFPKLIAALPELKQYVIRNPKGEMSISFSDPVAVKLLNKALLAYHYQVTNWDIPQGFLCPPIPGRADYIHRLHDLVTKDLPKLNQTKLYALDVGVGANCIYPIVGVTAYDWHCVGSDVDPVSVKNANWIAKQNAVLDGKIEARLQTSSAHFFKGIIRPGEYYHLTTCNPPFHKSLQDAQQGSLRKVNNLTANKAKRGQSLPKAANQASSILNFGGQKAELWCPGGEAAFIKNMAFESRDFASQVLWFSSLISKKDNVRWMRKNLEKAGAKEIHVVEMSQGQKISRFIVWSFHNHTQRTQWLARQP
ncbi:23S rRNA (adenine(1618)-N(6))-methyltransferase RlmF [Vibrio pacinii]|uniref:23S rRNA (adenine(1618)-N(6))-methyltransferase RlmF n=1 Tax=Vibrio pacinii TaxID=170674 RepID=UPI00056FA116